MYAAQVIPHEAPARYTPGSFSSRHAPYPIRVSGVARHNSRGTVQPIVHPRNGRICFDKRQQSEASKDNRKVTHVQHGVQSHHPLTKSSDSLRRGRPKMFNVAAPSTLRLSLCDTGAFWWMHFIGVAKMHFNADK
jgi:hypothetical protein